ncbi:MAG: cupredoxin domain-containing protein [Chloroflexi bacterium]|nr:cupredoxin domain-containing protein [Chloroflexota bacterium]
MLLFRMLCLLTLVFVLAACGNTASVREIMLDGTEFKYQPNTIEVVVGQPVRVTLRNTGLLEHDWSVADLPTINVRIVADNAPPGATEALHSAALHISAAKGKTSILEFTPTRAGTFTFFCDVPGHKEAGMVGKLIVKDK